MAGLAIFSSLISLYYYLQVIRQMYIESAPEAPVSDTAPDTSDQVVGVEGIPRTSLAASPSILLMGVLAIALAAVFWIGVYPSPLLEPIEAASRAILPGT